MCSIRNELMNNIDQNKICSTLLNEVKAGSEILHCFHLDQSSPDWRNTQHAHDYWELLYFIKGSAHIEGDYGLSDIAANDLIIYPPEYCHREFVDLKKHQEAICLGLTLNNELSSSDALTIPDPDHLLEWLFIQLSLRFKQKHSDMVHPLKELLFSYINDCLRIKSDVQQPMSNKIINYMEHHYSEKIYQKDLAELVNVSSTYMYKVFKEQTGQIPMDYLNRLRVQKARDLSSHKEMTLEEIGSRVGCYDPKYFSKLFKKYTGKSFQLWKKEN